MVAAPLLSVVTPAYNEAENLPALHARLQAVVPDTNMACEWIIVDDHSSDTTFQVCKRPWSVRSKRGRRTPREECVSMPVASDVVLGARVIIYHPELVNLYGCRLGDDTRVGTFVEIQRGVSIGRACKVSAHTFICEGVTIEDEVFIKDGG